jgi:Helix-turn-helix domain
MTQDDMFTRIKHTQTDDLLDYLRSHDGITPMQALFDLGIFRLASRIYDIKQRGIEIHDRMVTGTARNGRRYAVKEYRL